MLRTLSACIALATPLFMQAQSDVSWTPLGGGTNQQVQTLLRLNNGDLLVAGPFSFAGTTPCTRVARWDGTTYTAMPGFPEELDITSAAELNDTIYVGGIPNHPHTSDLMKWDGSTWADETVFYGMLPGVLSLLTHDGVLYASGRFTGVAGAGSRMAYLGDERWEEVGAGNGLNGDILSIGYFNGHLVCAGAFTGRGLTNGNDIQHVAYLDGDTWTQLGDGLDGTVYDLLVHDNALYATGDMRSPTASYFGLARISPEATAWEPLMPNIADYVRAPVSGMMAGRAMMERNGEIYIGGEFLIGTGSMLGRGLAVFHGAPDEVEAYGHFEGPVQAVELMNDHELVIAGRSSTYQHIASTNLLTNGTTDPAERSFFTLAPNPSPGPATIRLAGSTAEQVRISDINGRLVREVRTLQGRDVPIDLSGEPQGTYIIEVRSEGTVLRERLVLIR